MTISRDKETEFVSRFDEYSRTLDCVHCGLCIPYCPTHGVTGREADSPRGRIYLMRTYAEEGAPLSAEGERHLLECIVCRACETVCPSGIRMGDMMEAFRAELNELRPSRSPRAFLARFLLRHVLPHRERLSLLSDLIYVYQRTGLRRAVSAILRRVAPRLAALDALQPTLPAPHLRRVETSQARPQGYPAHGKPRMRVALFLGCITSDWFAATHHATIRVLQQNGCDVLVPDEQTCCGALHRHGGFLDDARNLHAKNVAAFARAGVDVVLVNAAGCGAALKEAPHGLDVEGMPPVRDICEFLDEIGIEPPGGKISRRVAYHQPCHLVHGQKVGPAVVEGLLRKVPGLELVPIEDSDRCCGSGGVYNLLHPEIASQVLEDKVRTILAAQAEIVVTGNPGCALQVRHGLSRTPEGAAIEVIHPVELLDRSYSAETSPR